MRGRIRHTDKGQAPSDALSPPHAELLQGLTALFVFIRGEKSCRVFFGVGTQHLAQITNLTLKSSRLKLVRDQLVQGVMVFSGVIVIFCDPPPQRTAGLFRDSA